MKILLWHGYLLAGTGSNVYTRSLARAWSRLGHELVLFCQEPHPDRFDLGGARVVRPDAGRTLPVFVLDRYEGLEPRLLQSLTVAERKRWVARNVDAVREHLPADLLFANHVLLGAPVGAGVGIPFGVKAHGSELEFSLRGSADLCRWARETLPAARAVYAGSEHIRRVLGELLGQGPYLERVRVVPPGVDVEALVPESRETALGRLLEQCRLDPPNPGRRFERLPDEGNTARLEAFLHDERPTVVYVGKLSREKGVQLLLAALAQLADVRALIVGFGPERRALEAQADRSAPGRALFTGPLEHRHLAHLWPLADVSVTPSVFPEAFGMVAAEAAACGSPPLVARQSGLAEIAAAIELEYPVGLRHLAAFESGDLGDLVTKLGEILSLPRAEWLELSLAARRAASARWSWEGVAAAILAGLWETSSA